MDAHERKFQYTVYGAPEPSADVRVAFAPVPESVVQELAPGLARKLAEPLPPIPPQVEARLKPGMVLQAPPLWAQMDVRGYPPLHARIDRFGQTAAMVTWLHRVMVEVGTNRRSGRVQAVSLYLTGLDRDADNCAISACQAQRNVDKPLPVGPGVFERMRDESRPLAVQIFCESLARIDPSIRVCFLGMAVAFFGSFGVDEPDGEM